MNIYTIYKAKAIDSVRSTGWSVYFKTVTYEEGIRFLQSMGNVTNATFTMVKTRAEGEIVEQKHAHQRLRDTIMNEFDAAAQSGQSHPYEQE